MKIVQVNFLEKTGGAARIAWSLYQSIKASEHESKMVVGVKESVDPDVLELLNTSNDSKINKSFKNFQNYLDQNDFQIFNKNASRLFHHLINIDVIIKEQLGIENYNFPGTWKFAKDFSDYDVIHLHNLHLNYFDLNAISDISSKTHTFLTLHDCWLMTGHCAHFLDCHKWITGCNKCPYLSLINPLKFDNSKINWLRKKKVFNSAKINLITPSKWMMDIAKQSILWPSIENAKVIHNGIDCKIFQPVSLSEKNALREKLFLPKETIIILFVVSGNMKKHPFKDFDTIEKALQQITEFRPNLDILFLGLGKSEKEIEYGKIKFKFMPYKSELADVASIYQASDIYIHSAKIDNFPNVVLEAMACGLSVIATDVGGISEQIVHGETGFLVKQQDYEDMAEKIIFLIDNPKMLQSFSKQAALIAQTKFDKNIMVKQHLNFYEETNINR